MPPNINLGAKPAPSVKVTVSHTAPSVRQAAAGVAGAAKSTGAPAKAAGRAPSASAGQAKPFNIISASPQQIADFSARITKQNTQAALLPLKQGAAQMRNSEATVQGRYAGYNATGDQILQGLQQNASQGALSNENLMAQQAQKTAQTIDQTGAAAQALNGGYQDPAVAAAQANQRQFAGTTMGAQAGMVASQGASEANFMGNLRGTAALQAVEGQNNIQSAYAKPIAANAAARQQLLAKEQPTANQLASTTGQQQFTDRATLMGLGIKSKAAQDAFMLGQGKNAVAAAQAGTAQFKAQSQAAYQQGALALGNSKLAVQQQNNLATQSIKQIDAKIAQGNLTEKQRHDLTDERIAWQRASKPNTGSGMSAAQSTAIAHITGGAALYAHMVTEGTAPEKAAGGITRQLRTGGAEAQAAIDLATGQHYVKPATVRLLALQGVTLPASMTTPPKGASKKGVWKP